MCFMESDGGQGDMVNQRGRKEDSKVVREKIRIGMG